MCVLEMSANGCDGSAHDKVQAAQTGGADLREQSAKHEFHSKVQKPVTVVCGFVETTNRALLGCVVPPNKSILQWGIFLF